MIEVKEPDRIETDGFSTWLQATIEVQKPDKTAVVPCGDCVACCTSSLFIHIRADEKAALSRIPKELLFPAPGLRDGSFVLGFTKQGHCPMFEKGKCSIYEDRPDTCRKFDCRVLTAANLNPEEKPAIARQAARWNFKMTDEKDRRELTAVRNAALFLNRNSSLFPSGFVPVNAPQRAALAIRIYQIFLDPVQKSDELLVEEIVRTLDCLT